MIPPQTSSSSQNPHAPWRESLSALVDGECRADELDAALRAGGSDVELRTTWNGYLAVGAALRGVSGCAAVPASAEFVVSVMDRLASEPRPEPAPIGRPRTEPVAPVMPTGRAANDAVWRWKLLAGIAAMTTLASLVWQFGHGPVAGPELARWEPAGPEIEPGPDVILAVPRASGPGRVMPASLERP